MTQSSSFFFCLPRKRLSCCRDAGEEAHVLGVSPRYMPPLGTNAAARPSGLFSSLVQPRSDRMYRQWKEGLGRLLTPLTPAIYSGGRRGSPSCHPELLSATSSAPLLMLTLLLSPPVLGWLYTDVPSAAEASSCLLSPWPCYSLDVGLEPVHLVFRNLPSGMTSTKVCAY